MTKVNARREKFFQKTAKLFHEKGYKATTMRTIAEHMGFEVANIYNYIDSKEALLEKFLFGISAEFHAGIDHIIDSQQAAKEKLRAVIALHIQLTTQKPHQVALLVNEWKNLKDTKTSKKLSEFINERVSYETKVKKVIKECMDSKAIRAMDIEVATFTILSTVRWLYDSYSQYSKKLKAQDLEQQLTDFIFKGIEN